MMLCFIIFTVMLVIIDNRNRRIRELESAFPDNLVPRRHRRKSGEAVFKWVILLTVTAFVLMIAGGA